LKQSCQEIRISADDENPDHGEHETQDRGRRQNPARADDQQQTDLEQAAAADYPLSSSAR
jgi:hypothetical protein